MRRDEDFSEYVVARWPDLVRQAVALGCPTDLAVDRTRAALTSCLVAWDRTREEADPELEVHRVLRRIVLASPRRVTPPERADTRLLTEVEVGPPPLQQMLEEGGSIRHRRTRRTLWVAVSLTVVVATTSALAHSLGLFGTLAQASLPTNSQVGHHPPLSGPVGHETRSRATGRSVAAALGYAVQEVAGGGQSDFAGQDWSGGGARRQTVAQLVWTPDRGAASVVRVVLRPPGAATSTACAAHQDCHVVRLDDRLTGRAGTASTWSAADETTPGSRTRYAELRRPDGLRVTAESTNATEARLLPGEPVLLSPDELTRIVSESWWGLRLPDSFSADGGHLMEYVDLSLGRATYPTTAPRG